MAWRWGGIVMPEERSKGHVGTDATRIYQRRVTLAPGLLQKLA